MSAVSLTEEQRNEIQLLRNEAISIRKELKSVQPVLRVDIEELESRLLFLNIGLLPCLFFIGTGNVGNEDSDIRKA